MESRSQVQRQLETRLREKLDGIAGERNVLEARLAPRAGSEERFRELDSLSGLVEPTCATCLTAWGGSVSCASTRPSRRS